MLRDKSGAKEKESKPSDGRGSYDPLRPIKGRLVELLSKDIKADALEYQRDLHKRTYKKIRQQKDSHSVSITAKNLARRKLQRSKEDRAYENARKMRERREAERREVANLDIDTGDAVQNAMNQVKKS